MANNLNCYRTVVKMRVDCVCERTTVGSENSVPDMSVEKMDKLIMRGL